MIKLYFVGSPRRGWDAKVYRMPKQLALLGVAEIEEMVPFFLCEENDCAIIIPERKNNCRLKRYFKKRGRKPHSEFSVPRFGHLKGSLDKARTVKNDICCNMFVRT